MDKKIGLEHTIRNIVSESLGAGVTTDKFKGTQKAFLQPAPQIKPKVGDDHPDGSAVTAKRGLAKINQSETMKEEEQIDEVLKKRAPGVDDEGTEGHRAFNPWKGGGGGSTVMPYGGASQLAKPGRSPDFVPDKKPAYVPSSPNVPQRGPSRRGTPAPGPRGPGRYVPAPAKPSGPPTRKPPEKKPADKPVEAPPAPKPVQNPPAPKPVETPKPVQAPPAQKPVVPAPQKSPAGLPAETPAPAKPVAPAAVPGKKPDIGPTQQPSSQPLPAATPAPAPKQAPDAGKNPAADPLHAPALQQAAAAATATAAATAAASRIGDRGGRHNRGGRRRGGFPFGSPNMPDTTGTPVGGAASAKDVANFVHRAGGRKPDRFAKTSYSEEYNLQDAEEIKRKSRKAQIIRKIIDEQKKKKRDTSTVDLHPKLKTEEPDQN